MLPAGTSSPSLSADELAKRAAWVKANAALWAAFKSCRENSLAADKARKAWFASVEMERLRRAAAGGGW